MLFLPEQKWCESSCQGGGRHSGCFGELGRTGSEVQFELAEFAKKRANQLFKDVLSEDGLGGGVGVHVDELSLQTKEDM